MNTVGFWVGEMKELKHYPVMYREVVDLLDIGKRAVVVDCTVGLGGHSAEFLKRMGKDSFLLGIDQDREALNIAATNLKSFEGRFSLFGSNFSDLDKVLKQYDIAGVDAFLFDLGVSRYQLDESQRGFSFLKDGPLDMRMDRDLAVCAYDLINSLSENELIRIFKDFGQERYSRRIAHSIVESRKSNPISTTSELAQLVVSAVPSKRSCYRIHPATRVFQALRIAVNRELQALTEGLNTAIGFLNREGRIAVISFHSLEDRIVKTTFKHFSHQGVLKILTKKPLTPGDLELEENVASRSAKLRVAEKI